MMIITGRLRVAVPYFEIMHYNIAKGRRTHYLYHNILSQQQYLTYSSIVFISLLKNAAKIYQIYMFIKRDLHVFNNTSTKYICYL